MFKRSFMALSVVAALGVAFPVQAAARPNDSGGSMVNQRGTVVVHRSAPIVSEKLVGLNLHGQRVSPVASGTLDPWQQNLNARAEYAQVTDPWALNLFARQSHSDSGNTTVPSTVSALSTGGFDWSDAGVGAAFVFGVMLLGAASVATLRRHHGPIAH